jgi:hypothetical protein
MSGTLTIIGGHEDKSRERSVLKEVARHCPRAGSG